ncbi:hypothetical protein D039_0550, partial [Vibrio parahaemolyticus EKP-028]
MARLGLTGVFSTAI